MNDNITKERKSLKIGQINIEAGRGTTTGIPEYFRNIRKIFLPYSQNQIITAGEFISREGIDIACLSEIDGGSLRTYNTNQTELVSKTSGLNHKAYFEAYRVFGSMASLGNAIISKYPIIKTESFRLPGGFNPRIVGKAVLDVDGEEVDVYSTHLSLGNGHRDNQLDYLSKIINGSNRTILGADLNEDRISKLEELAKNSNLDIAHTTHTFPSWDPSWIDTNIFGGIKTYDRLMTRGFEVYNSRAHNNEKFSDHFPITADIYFEK